MADSKEAQFQQDIVDSLVASGWQLGKASQYDRATALYPEDVIAYQKAAWPERWDKLCASNPQKPEQVLIQQVERHLKKVGTLAVLRHGFKMPGNTLVMCSFMPDHAMNPESVQRYQANILRVVPEVSYSPHAKDSSNGEASYNPRLDLVLFVNGLPVATLELKSAFKQSLEAAKRQYRKDRPLKDPITRKEEPLLAFKRGALVHFVARQDEIAMTTRLAGDKTFFLPFNRGSEEGGAGNPPAEDANSYATDYLWKQVLQPDAWLKIIGRFLHLEEKTSEDFAGNRITKETMIFPRFHQWQVVNQLLEATRNEGAGNRYLIQHSAGSGKSNSIAWTAHQLANLYAEDGSRMFNSVIVVTDRTVLDSQLQNTIYQFEHAYGVVCPISREGASASKSAQLADALAANTRIIIVTLQTFPALFDALEKRPKLAEGHYAVIADEAHSSQTGSSAGQAEGPAQQRRADQ